MPRPQPTAAPPPGPADDGHEAAEAAKRSESDVLTAEAEQARAAMHQVTNDLVALLKDTADIKGLLGDHPWVLLGGAAAAGFALASAFTPSRDEKFVERLKSLMPERKADGPAMVLVPADVAAALTGGNAAPAAPKPGAAGSVLHHVFDAVKTAIVATLTSAVSAKVAQQPTSGDAVAAGASDAGAGPAAGPAVGGN